ncbi:esterase/lipase family protein [Micromonospora halophytica]|uniref:Triacylglycerol lipase n=1 Tax=Micromonospora halophytica TaxID=47864 RepID=A0A1C5HIA2_9ACTN|nr:alpha/beta fold hydrolase [Micromonospora halophytica]SCG45704.1 triacylglycerol lipase [Micromonospora halophytica]
MAVPPDGTIAHTRWARLTALAASVLVAVVTAVFGAAAPAAATPRNPVIFVHGFLGEVKTDWSVLVEEFRKEGVTSLWEFTYWSPQSNKTTAQELAKAVDSVLAQTGAAKVDIVTHSMGGLNSRWYLKFLGGTSKVDAWVSLGGPNHGTGWAYACWVQACYDMRPGSGLLTTLNAGDETPGSVRYATWWSPCDGIINPDSSVILSGATNTKTGCIGHNSIPTNRTVAAQVVGFAM